MVGEVMGDWMATPSIFRKMELSAFTTPFTVRLLDLSTVKFFRAIVCPIPESMFTGPPLGVMVSDWPPAVVPCKPPTEIPAVESVAVRVVSAPRVSGPLIQIPPGPVAVRFGGLRAMPSLAFSLISTRLSADLAVPV